MQRRVLCLVVVFLGRLAIPADLNAQDAAEYLKRAEAWSEKREYDKVITECGNALSLDPKFVEAYNARGIAWFEKREYDKAIADCNQALAINPKFAGAYITRGNILIEHGDSNKAIADWKHALAITPDDWKILNNLGVGSWKQAQEQEIKAAKAKAAGDLMAANTYHQKSIDLKADAKGHWNRGVTVNPMAFDIHSNLGYAYSEANDIDSAERHLIEAVRLKPISPRPRNNLGRVLLRRSQECEAKAREAEAKGKTDPAETAKAKQLTGEAKVKLDAAIEQFEKAVRLDPSLLEARLNRSSGASFSESIAAVRGYDTLGLQNVASKMHSLLLTSAMLLRIIPA